MIRVPRFECINELSTIFHSHTVQENVGSSVMSTKVWNFLQLLSHTTISAFLLALSAPDLLHSSCMSHLRLSFLVLDRDLHAPEPVITPFLNIFFTLHRPVSTAANIF